MEKYTLSFSKSVKSDHNQNFWYFPNNDIETTKIFSVRSSPDPAKIGFSLDPCSSLIDTIAIGNPERHVPKASHQCCPGSGFLESDPADLWDFFGSGDGLDIIFAQTGSGSGLSKTVWTHHFCSNRIIQNRLNTLAFMYFTSQLHICYFTSCSFHPGLYMGMFMLCLFALSDFVYMHFRAFIISFIKYCVFNSKLLCACNRCCCAVDPYDLSPTLCDSNTTSIC